MRTSGEARFCGEANKYTHIAEADNIKFANALHCTASLYKIHTRIYKESTNTHIIRISNTNIYTKLHIFLSHYYIAVCTKSTLVRFPALSIATAVRPTNMVYFAFESSAPYLATLWMVVVRPQMNSIREYILNKSPRVNKITWGGAAAASYGGFCVYIFCFSRALFFLCHNNVTFTIYSYHEPLYN